MIRIGWFGDDGKLAIGPIEISGIDHHPADASSMSAKELGSGVNNDISPPLDGPTEVRRGKSVVHNQRYRVTVGDLGDSLNVHDVTARITDRFAEE